MKENQDPNVWMLSSGLVLWGIYLLIWMSFSGINPIILAVGLFYLMSGVGTYLQFRIAYVAAFALSVFTLFFIAPVAIIPQVGAYSIIPQAGTPFVLGILLEVFTIIYLLKPGVLSQYFPNSRISSSYNKLIKKSWLKHFSTKDSYCGSLLYADLSLFGCALLAFFVGRPLTSAALIIMAISFDLLFLLIAENSRNDNFGIGGNHRRKENRKHVKGWRIKGGEGFSSGDDSQVVDEARYFRLLGVAPGAGSDEIKSAWRKRCQEYHPDKMGDFHGTPQQRDLIIERQMEINEAYEFLIKRFEENF